MGFVAGMAGCRLDLPSPPQSGAHPAPQEQPLPVLPGGEARREPVQTAAVEPDPPEREVAPRVNPDSLIGLDRKAIGALLGPPTFVRRDKPTELWRYRHGSCALALFFYADGPGRDATFRVRHLESWAPGGEQTPPGECLNDLARLARQQPTG